MTALPPKPSPIWHPYTQMQTAPAAVNIVRGQGARLFREDGSSLIDAISSWWVTVHGHAHPYVAEAIAQQAHTLEQVIFAGFTHPQANRLARRMVEALPDPLSKVFFSDDGSTAIEVALKMAWQYWQNKGQGRSRILALQHAYHGDTFGAMSVSGRSVFTRSFEELLFEVDFLPSPGEVDPEQVLQALDEKIRDGNTAALMLEPLVQGAGGMLMYPPELLDEMIARCREKEVLVIFDEVMTGFYRTGRQFAMDHCQLKPDIACFSKGLTGGFLPLSLTVASEEIYQAFLSDDRSQMLFHGHSFTANPIGCAAANASMDLFEQAATQTMIRELCQAQEQAAESFSELSCFRNVRQTGTILAMDIVSEGQTHYLNSVGPDLARWFLDRGVLLRPLGNVLYLMPPYTIEKEELQFVHELVPKGVKEVLGKN